VSSASAVSRAEPGTADPVKAVSVVSTGTVEIHPEQPYRSRKPLYWWILTSRRWTPPRSINAYVIEHARGLILFDTGQDRASVTDNSYFPGGLTGIIYDRLAPFPHRRGGHPHRPARHTRVRAGRRHHGDPVAPAPGPHRRASRAAGRAAAGLVRRMGRACQALPRAARVPAPAHPASRAEVAPGQPRADGRPHAGAVHRITGHHGRRFAGAAAHTRSHGRLDVAADAPTGPPAAAAGGRPPTVPTSWRAAGFLAWASAAASASPQARSWRSRRPHQVWSSCRPMTRPRSAACLRADGQAAMATFVNTVVIDRPAAEVFAFLADFENLPAWNYAIQDTIKTSPARSGLDQRTGRPVPSPAEARRVSRSPPSSRSVGSPSRVSSAPSGRAPAICSNRTEARRGSSTR
jgi:hypothetical protein